MCPSPNEKPRRPRQSLNESFVRTILKKKGALANTPARSNVFFVILLLVIDPSSATLPDPPPKREFHPVHFELDLAPLIETAQNVSSLLNETHDKLSSGKSKIYPSMPINVSTNLLFFHIFYQFYQINCFSSFQGDLTLDARVQIAFNQTTKLTQDFLALDLNVTRSRLNKAWNDTLESVTTILNQSSDGKVHTFGAPFIVSEPLTDDPSYSTLHRLTEENSWKYDSLRRTPKTLCWKDLTSDLLLITIAKDIYKSKQIKRKLQDIRDAISSVTSNSVMNGFVDWLVNYGNYLTDKIEKLGLGFLNLKVHYLTEDIIPKHDLHDLILTENVELAAQGYKIGCTVEEAYHYG